jgi:hypothetical protein
MSCECNTPQQIVCVNLLTGPRGLPGRPGTVGDVLLAEFTGNGTADTFGPLPGAVRTGDAPERHLVTVGGLPQRVDAYRIFSGGLGSIRFSEVIPSTLKLEIRTLC